MVRALDCLGVVVLPACLASCGPDAANDKPLRTSSNLQECLPGYCLEAAAPPPIDGSSGGNMPLEPWPDSNAEAISGVFAMQAVVTAEVAGLPVPPLRLLFRLRILQTPSQTRQSNTLCALKLPSVSVAKIVVPPLLQRVIQQHSVAEAEGPFLSSTTGDYRPPQFLVVLGAKLQKPATDPLPTMTDLTGEWDEDHDGHPGVTVDATTFLCSNVTQELYVALRTGGTLKGKVSGTATIDGTLDLFEAEEVLGYSASCLSAAANISTTIEPNSPFHAQRLADESQLHSTGNVTCADIVAQAPELFGKAWAP